MTREQMIDAAVLNVASKSFWKQQPIGDAWWHVMHFPVLAHIVASKFRRALERQPRAPNGRFIKRAKA